MAITDLTGYTWVGNDTILGGTDATNPTLIAWLEANGTLTKSGRGSTLDVTYNSQKIIDGIEVTPPVTVTYNGSTIATLNAGDTKTLQCSGKVMASNIGIGGKTLQCNGKLMASDVVVEVGRGGAPMPAKGDLITMDLGAPTPTAGLANQYRILSINGTVAEVLAMFDAVETAFDTDRTSTYAGKTLDVYLNTTWYGSLNAAAKGAIVAKNINQYQYVYRSSVYSVTTHPSYADYSTKSLKANVGNRNVYALDVEDVETYFNGTFATTDIWTLFWNTTAKPSTVTAPILRSAQSSSSIGVWYVFGGRGDVLGGIANASFAARPAFQIDLSKISWAPVN